VYQITKDRIFSVGTSETVNNNGGIPPMIDVGLNNPVSLIRETPTD
jgi:hypothetical protein